MFYNLCMEEHNRKAKPFIKWVGGKTQLIEQINNIIPDDFKDLNDVVYVEPFIGGGAMFFYMIQKYTNINKNKSIINDANNQLVNCYRMVQNNPQELIDVLKKLQDQYYSLTEEDRSQLFYNVRTAFNAFNLSSIELAAYFIFLNKTCFNGLYRVNKNGKFNVPFGKYKNPKIVDEEVFNEDSELLNGVRILNEDYSKTLDRISEDEKNVLFYFDPPYRPLNRTSSFTSYTSGGFNDAEQRRLKSFCDKINNRGFKFILSNSKCSDAFFEDLYKDYRIEEVKAGRSINSDGKNRGKISEILVTNFPRKI